MTSSRVFRAAVCVLAAASFGASEALAADDAPTGPPPPPTAAAGAEVQALGFGVPTPTEFAFGSRGAVFVSAAGDERTSAPGGVFIVRNGAATRLARSPPSAFGVAWSKGTLYVAAGTKLLAWSGWDGSDFAKRKTIYTGPKRFPGFNGIAVGPNGRIYAGVTMPEKYDHKKSRLPFGQSVISVKTDGSDVRVVAKGLRQPWMPTFAKGQRTPLMTVLGQENLGRNQPPDYVVRLRNGQNYGFPACNWSKPKACKGYAKPVSLLPAHSSPMGIAVVGKRVYLALFSGTGRGPAVVSTRLGASKTKPVLSGFVAPVVALGAHGGWLYTGDLTGTIYRAKL